MVAIHTYNTRLDSCSCQEHAHARVCPALTYSIHPSSLIKRNFEHLDSQTFVQLYKSLVRSNLEYAVTVWNPHKEYLIEELEKVQRKATKIVKECRSKSYLERLQHLKLPTLKYRRTRGDMIEVYKILHNKYD